MRSDQTQDGELLAGVARGDAEAFGLLFRRHRAHVYRFALHMTASSWIAEDVAQDTFVAVMRDAGRYDPARATAVAWLCGIARNFVLRRLEGDRRFQPLEDDEGQDAAARNDERWLAEEDVLGSLTRAEQVDAVRDAVLTLPVRYREAVVLCDLQELSYADAASALGCAIGTVRSRLHRGRALLAAKLSGAATPLKQETVEGEPAHERPADRNPGPRPLEFTVRSARNPV